MMHLEQEKLNQKIQEFLQQKNILNSIDINKASQKITLGSLVQANGIWFFISTALPPMVINDKKVIAVSAQSPLGNQLLGNAVGHSFIVNGTSYLIEVIEL